jgi:polyhydroxybutyrate depolymerase
VVSPQGLDTEIPISGGVVAPFWNISPAVDTSQIEGPGLSAADDIGFVNALLDELETDLCLDAEREYLTGISNGAAMATALICGDDQRFAAAAPVAGANFVSSCAAEDLTPILAVHGDADVLAPYEGGDVFGFPLGLPAVEDQLADLAAIGGCGADSEIETIGDDVEHRTWDGCEGDAEVELYTVLGGGHTWPGSPLFADGLPAEPSDDQAASDRAAEAEGALGFDLDEILGEPTGTIDATALILSFFDRHTRG